MAEQGITVDAPGKVVVRFEGQCLSSPGDRIMLAASDGVNWAPNAGAVGVEAYNGDLNVSPFTHSRIYDVTSGSYTFYAVGENSVEQDGSGIASIAGCLSVTYFPSSTDLTCMVADTVESTSIDVRTSPAKVGEVTVVPDFSGTAIIRFDGYCVSSPGDVIILAVTTDSTTFVGNNGHTSVEAKSSDIDHNSFATTRRFEVTAGEEYTYYAIALNALTGRDGTGEASVYGSLRAEILPTGAVARAGIVEVGKNVRGEPVSLAGVELSAPADGLILVELDGWCTSSPGDRIGFAASDAVRLLSGDQRVGVEALSDEVNRNAFMHTRAYPVTEGQHIYYAVSQNINEMDGTGRIDVYANLAARFVPDVHKPDLVVSSLTVDSHTASSISYTFTVKNIGTAPVDLESVEAQGFLSADTIFNNSGDIAAGRKVLGEGSLAPGDSVTETFSAGAVSVDPSATPFLTFKVDWGSSIDELDESNNTAAARLDETGIVRRGSMNGPRSLALTLEKVLQRGTAVVSYALPSAASVHLAVYNSLGEELEVLKSGSCAAGRHRVAFGTAGFANGSYVLGFEVDGKRVAVTPFVISR